jgi:hypothetical protein
MKAKTSKKPLPKAARKRLQEYRMLRNPKVQRALELLYGKPVPTPVEADEEHPLERRRSTLFRN